MAPVRGSRNGKSVGPVQGSASGLRTCPFKFFHECKDGKPGSVGFFRLLEHMQSTHLKTECRRLSLKGAISKDLDLFLDVAEVLRAGGKWLCGKCMVMHALSRGCKHDNEVVLFAINSGDVEDFIVGIRKPCQVVVDTNPRHPAGLAGKVNLLEHVFSLPIQTVKSIPPSCRLLFAQVLTGALRKVVASPGSVDNWVQLLLLPRCTLRVVRPSSRQERRSGNRKSLQCSNILRALTVWKDGSGFDDLVSSLLDSVEETGAPKGECRREEDKERDPNIKQCLRKVRDGHFTAAVKVLCSSGVAPLGDSTLKVLIDKHPVVPPPSLPSNPLAQPTLVVDGECVLKCIRSFPKGTSCGRDGMRAQHLLDAVGGEGSTTSSGLLASITEVVNLWLGDPALRNSAYCCGGYLAKVGFQGGDEEGRERNDPVLGRPSIWGRDAKWSRGSASQCKPVSQLVSCRWFLSLAYCGFLQCFQHGRPHNLSPRGSSALPVNLSVGPISLRPAC
ncbi:hypothetical protein E3N88_13177 [Mikania micrantha]|uniref:Uncharacterized protein n=1 Tax=Mikania micrantha TaxID=192012 RepID=A0A5N6P8V6_9ASTR|nr:hypothetical protein E3N88_13177 [Mikania micrantha]